MSAGTPGWNPDPTGRHEYRYWDGGTWTDDVSDGGVTSVDPVASPGPGGEPTAPFDATQAYAPQPGGYVPQPGPGPGGFGPQPGYDPYGTGGQPPGQPVKSGPPTGLIVGLALAAVVLIVGVAFLLTRGDDDETATDDPTSTTEDDGGDTPTTEATTPTTEPTTTTAAGPQDADVFSLAVGDCLVDDTSDTEVQEVGVVPCDQPHVSEIFYSHMITATELPDEAGMETIVSDVCFTQFESFIGLAYADSGLQVTWLQPTQGSWDSGDRELLCMVVDPAGDVSGSLAGAAR